MFHTTAGLCNKETMPVVNTVKNTNSSMEAIIMIAIFMLFTKKFYIS